MVLIGLRIQALETNISVSTYSTCTCTCTCTGIEAKSLASQLHKELSTNLFKGDRAFQVKYEFGNVGFCGGTKTGVPGAQSLEQG